jgi:hypothetical protein
MPRDLLLFAEKTHHGRKDGGREILRCAQDDPRDSVRWDLLPYTNDQGRFH